jgi:phage terminase large subunit GpA-like protein
MYDCEECMSFFVKCPCCDESFCPDCGKTEADEEEE